MQEKLKELLAILDSKYDNDSIASSEEGMRDLLIAILSKEI